MKRLKFLSIVIGGLIITPQTFAFNHKGVGTPPTVVSISPINNATSVNLDSNIVITFDEAVSLGLDATSPSTDNSIIIDCNLSGIQFYPPTDEFDVTIVDINTNDFSAGDICTVTVSEFWVHDIDSGNHFDGNGDGVSDPNGDAFVSMFTVAGGIDTPPQVSMVTPSDLSTGVPPETLVTLVFNEPVDIPPNAITIDCSVSGTQNFPSVLTTPVTSISYDPVDFIDGESCEIIASTLLIHDVDGFPEHLDGDGDGIANGDDFESSFTVSESSTVLIFVNGFE